MMNIPKSFCMIVLLAVLIPQTANAQVDFRVKWLTIDANEGIASGDIDGDGHLDLVAGRNWYRGPDWIARPLRAIADWNGYVESNGDFLFDVNGDGHLDVVAGSFLPTEIHWYENPGRQALKLGNQWKQHLLVDTGNSSNEGQMLQDLDGDGTPEWIVNSWRKDVPAVVWRLERKADAKSLPPSESKYRVVSHQLGLRGNGHGLGIGDLNGDGRPDILMGQGWYEQPESAWATPWKFHRDWDIHASLPIIVTDVDGDGKNDLIVGQAHNYGLHWWRNLGTDKQGQLKWEKLEIDRSFSQPHTLAWVDIDNDGASELITGKRFRAHNGNDPGGQEPPCLYYYDYDSTTGKFTRQTIEEGHVGCGLQIVATDLNGDQKTDIAVAGKSGTFVLLAK